MVNYRNKAITYLVNISENLWLLLRYDGENYMQFRFELTSEGKFINLDAMLNMKVDKINITPEIFFLYKLHDINLKTIVK